MTVSNVEKQMQELQEQLQEASDAYYIGATSIMTDAQFDSKLQELIKLEEEFPEYGYPDSITKRVGADLENDFAKITHKRQVLSLMNALSSDTLMDWAKKIYKETHKLDFTITPKMDGLSVVLVYRFGQLVSAATRGNGLIGDDVLANAKTIRNIPLTLDAQAYTKYGAKEVIVRGEVVIEKEDFERYNVNGVYANSRNLAAGSLKQKNPLETAKRPLKFYAFDIMSWDTQDPFSKGSHHKLLHALVDYGFDVPLWDFVTSLEELESRIENWKTYRNEWAYEIDGMVVRLDWTDIFEELGVSSKAPRGAIAYKFQEEVAFAELESIEWNVGRTGAIVPTAILVPFQIGGVTVGRATMHNATNVKTQGYRVGDKLEIVRSGDVIPYIKDVEEPSNGEQLLPPTTCPSCGKNVYQEKDVAHLFCENPRCDAVRFGQLMHFIETLEFDGISSSFIQKLYDAALIYRPSDLYNKAVVNEISLAKLDGFGSKKIKQFFDMLEKSKTYSWEKILASFGIDLVGNSISKKIAPKISAKELYENKYTQLEIQELTGIGQAAAKSLLKWLSFSDNITELLILEQIGLQTTAVQKVAVQSPVSGIKFCITGTLSVGRDEMTKKLEDLGAEVGSLSKKTNYLLAGDNAGSKLEKAKELNVKVITEQELEQMLKG